MMPSRPADRVEPAACSTALRLAALAAVRPALSRLKQAIREVADRVQPRPPDLLDLAIADVRRAIVMSRRALHVLRFELDELEREANEQIALGRRVLDEGRSGLR